MKKYLLPIIFILLLTFALSVYSADLYSTYDQRIKLTIDNTKVDATLTWIPITVLLTSTAGEEVFVEFDADADFDKVAFTKSDGTTELYADCEKFDDSAQIAIYHVSRDGWEISSSADTDFYMYYDDDASSNTTYIGESGGTAAQSVYDANFKAVYHMNDQQSLPDFYDTQYEATAEPDSDGWTLLGTDYSSVAGGILTIDTTGGSAYSCAYYKGPDVDFNGGFYYKIRVQIHSDTPANGYLQTHIRDGTQDEQTYLNIFDGKIQVRTSVGGWNDTVVTTTDTYHIYEIYIKGTTVLVYMDGVLKDTQTVESASVTDRVMFGDYSTTAGANVECMIDYVYYALGIADNPVTTIFDSTSNNNDGTKKGGGEPVEATGKVGQGQHFDGSDDYIELADDSFESDSLGTIEAILNKDTVLKNYEMVLSSSVETANNLLQFTSHGDVDDKSHFQHYASGTASDHNDYVNSDTAYDATAHHVALTSSGTAWAFYLDGVADGCTVGGGSNTGDWFADLPAGTHKVKLGHITWDTTSIYSLDGILDEVRYSDVERNAAWKKATYNSLWDSLLTYGSEETSAVDNVTFFGTNF